MDVLVQGHLLTLLSICVAEDKFKDRLAQVAREKLGMLSKEKQLQLERKKKAMAFLNQIKGELEFEREFDKRIHWFRCRHYESVIIRRTHYIADVTRSHSTNERKTDASSIDTKQHRIRCHH